MTRDAALIDRPRRWARTGVALGVAMGLAVGGGAAVAGTASAPRQATVPAPAAPASAEFVGITPVRVLDTRGRDGGPIGVTTAKPLGQQQALDVVIAGKNGIPAEATSVAVNVTLDDDATAKSFLTVYPTGQTRPNASTNNAEPGLVMSNSAIFALGTGGQLTVFNQQGLVNVIIDVTGYFVDTPEDPDPFVTTNTVEYTAGAPVTYTGTGWTGCTDITVDVFGPDGMPVDDGIAATAGSFTGTFTAPAPGFYLLVARSAAAPACNAVTSFEVAPAAG